MRVRVRSRWVVLLVLLVAPGGCGDDDSSTSVPGFEEFAWDDREPDARSERLCVEADDPDRAADTTFIDCRVEGGRFAGGSSSTDGEIVVVAWNILRGFEVDRQIELLQREAFAPLPDILLLSEADRGCRRTDFRNIARDFARALGFYYVYGTEFVELPNQRGFDGPYDPPLCEHGNAIVSRYPLGNVRAIRHAANRSWYTPPGIPDPDEPRLGGRIAVAADALIGDRLVSFYVVHFESDLSTLEIRDAQAEEVAADGLASPHPVVVGGDLNSYGAISDIRTGRATDRPTQAFLTSGYADAHAALAPDERVTTPLGLAIDFLFLQGDLTVVEAGLCDMELCNPLSDHLPVWARIRLPRME